MGGGAFAIEIGSDLHGAPRRWEAGMAVSPYSTLNLRSGRVLTTLPIVSYDGRGPSVSFSLFHNMTSEHGILLPVESGGGSQGIMGDANSDGELDLADVDPFLDIVMAESPTAGQVAIADFTGDIQADSNDVDAFGGALGMALGGPQWTHSYSANLTVQGGTVTLIRDDATVDKFTWYAAESRYVAPPGVYEKLEKEVNGLGQTIGFLLTSKNQWRTHFTAQGRLEWIADATVELDENNVPRNRVRCIYSSGASVSRPQGSSGRSRMPRGGSWSCGTTPMAS